MTSLQTQLNQKNELVEKYRGMVQKVRAELAAKMIESKSIDQKNKELHAMNLREIERFQAPETDVVVPTEKEIGPELDMVRDLQKMLSAKVSTPD